jgi:hypothetical protein
MTIQDWGPFGISRIARAATHRAYRRLHRAGNTGEAQRFWRWFGADYQRDAAELIVANLRPELIQADARAVLRQLSTTLMIRHLQAEINGQKKRQKA